LAAMILFYGGVPLAPDSYQSFKSYRAFFNLSVTSF